MFGTHSHGGRTCNHSHGAQEKLSTGFNDDEIKSTDVVTKMPTKNNGLNILAQKQDELLKKQIEITRKKSKEFEHAQILEAISKKDYSRLDAVKSVQFGILEQLKQLVETNKVDPNRPDNENVYLLHWAAYNNRLEIAEYLLSLGCAVDQVGGELETTPFNWAARAGHVELVAFLMKNGANPEATDIDGYSAIHLAAMFNHSIIVAYLLARGIDVIINQIKFKIIFIKFTLLSG